MIITIKATNIELTAAIRNYVEEKISSLDKCLNHFDPESVLVKVEVGKTTQHHQKGLVFRAEANLTVPRNFFRAEDETTDLYASIDAVHDELKRQIVTLKEKAVKEKVRRARKNKEKI